MSDTDQLEFLLMRRLLTMTPQKFGKLEASEQRVLAKAARRYEKRFGEIANMMTRNVRAAKTPWPLTGIR